MANNEFYTRRCDIDAELTHYADRFRGKAVYCNCDDWRASRFFHYFRDNFHALGLTNLMAKAYRPEGRGVGSVFNGVDGEEFRLKGNGDFRSDECMKILGKSDIVVTNPPFSAAYDHITRLFKADKKFLVVGKITAVAHRDIFPLLRDGVLMLGVNPRIGFFDSPAGEVKPVACYWFTNMRVRKPRPKLNLTRVYTPREYPRYDNYDAIEVNRVRDIPKDYDGVMGVSIRWFEHHVPEDFDIVGTSASWDDFGGAGVHNAFLDGVELFRRIFIRRKRDHAPRP